jgi:hypothetical protein
MLPGGVKGRFLRLGRIFKSLIFLDLWMRGLDLNLRPSGYEWKQENYAGLRRSPSFLRIFSDMVGFLLPADHSVFRAQTPNFSPSCFQYAS